MRQVTTAQATVELITGVSRVSTTSEVWVGLRFLLPGQWQHLLEESGDSGGLPTVTWQLPTGITARDIV